MGTSLEARKGTLVGISRPCTSASIPRVESGLSVVIVPTMCVEGVARVGSVGDHRDYAVKKNCKTFKQKVMGPREVPAAVLGKASGVQGFSARYDGLAN